MKTNEETSYYLWLDTKKTMASNLVNSKIGDFEDLI